MKVSCQRDALLHSVSIAASVAPPRSTKPILSGVKIVASKSGIVVLATDLDVSVRAKLSEMIVETPGEVVIPAQTLHEILRSIESDEVRIEVSGRNCEISSDDVDYKIVTDDPDEFPDLAPATNEGVVVPRNFLEEMFARTAYAAARDVGRYAINGVLVEIGEGRLRFVATDGRRLAMATRPLPDANFPVKKAIVPVKGLQECLKGTEGDTNVRVFVSDDRVVFSSESCEVTTKPVEGEFPDYQAVIPREHKGRVARERDALLGAIRKASVMAGDEMRSIRLQLDKTTLNLSARVEGRGQAKTSNVEAEVEGESSLMVDYNPDFLIDFLKPLKSETVVLEFRDANSAAVLKTGAADEVYVVMPITTN
ncbi:MAG: DNA polymerase III subunit beta [Planctomycetes bacterium]|nr:DNA polymerase III subunit beta [Planctomycetota bacterium]